MPENAERRDRMLLRRMTRILGRRVYRMEGVTVYKGGFVELAKVMEKAPFFRRTEMSEADVSAKLEADEENRFTVQGKYVKVNSGHSFDINKEDLPDLPSE